MTLADEARAMQWIQGPDCGVAVLRRADPGLADELEAALREGVQIAAIVRALKARGGPVATDKTISRHRKGDCACPR